MADNPVNTNVKLATTGLVLDSVLSQMPQGTLSWATNAVIESFDGNQVTYSNEQANTKCVDWPSGFQPIGLRNIIEENLIIAWLLDPSTLDCEIGVVKNCVYTKMINAPCLNFSIDFPILKHTHRKTNCGLEVYWVDGRNRTRWIQFEKLPYTQQNDQNGCGFILTSEIDCNKLNLQPDFSIPKIEVVGINAGGNLIEGKYFFGFQYSNALGEPYTSYYSITEGVPLFEGTQATQNFNNPVSKNIALKISGIDQSGVFDYFNVVVVEVVNAIATPKLVGTFQITESIRNLTYSGAGTPIEQDIQEIFQKYTIYDRAGDITTCVDVLILADVKEEDRVNYQSIANGISLKWATTRLDGKHKPYAMPINATSYEGYLRDEVYALEIAFVLKNGHLTDGFHIPGRASTADDLILILNDDVSTNNPSVCNEGATPLPKWKVYNTGSNDGNAPQEADDCYEGPWETGELAYWESPETYPCSDVYGELSGKPIRHSKMPDCSVTHIHDEHGFIYPIGIQIDVQQVVDLIKASSLTDEQKSQIQGFKILRGRREENNFSISGKGLLTNVLKASTENKIINPDTNTTATGQAGQEATGRDTLEKAFDLTNQAHRESNASNFLSGTIFAGQKAEQNARYNRAERLLTDVRDKSSVDFFSEDSVNTLQQASDQLQNIINNSGNDERGKAHSQAAKALVDSLIQLMTAFINLQNDLNGIDLTVVEQTDTNKFEYFPNFLFNDVRLGADGKPSDFFLDNTIIDDDSKYRQCLHSPDLSFYQQSMGSQLKLETAEYGASTGHIVQTKNHAKYQFISEIGYITALLAGVVVGFGSGSYGIGSVNVFNGQAMFTAYQAFLEILYKTVPKKNFAYQFNAVGNYSSFKNVPNDGNKIRNLDIATYLSPGRLNVDDKYTVNNYQRETSVYLRTTKPLPYTNEIQGVPKDSSKVAGATYDPITVPISSYYASLKNNVPNQWGQLYSYSTIDTGYFKKLDGGPYTKEIVYGGDTYINKFAYKSKIPFFIDNRINPHDSVIWQDGSDISYNELSNVGRVKYWFSTDARANTSFFSSFFATMTEHFFWPQISELYMYGIIFLFAYGIPVFFCESNVNVDLRQAYNNAEGDFYPRVSSGIPDDWLQETYVPIAYDNTYWYNKSFSKQNDFTSFTHIPPDYDFNKCRVEFPNRGVFSEAMTDDVNPSLRNNWRIFKPASKFDFPQNYGKLTSVDGIESRQLLARFENTTILYNALLTAPSSVADVYLGSALFDRRVPPLEYASTDSGYIGNSHKMFIRTPFGHIIADSKRGDIFLLQGQKSTPLTSSGTEKFFTEFLDFQISRYFPEVNTDNHFKGIGLHGVYDPKYERIVITKLDYKPLMSNIFYKNGVFVNNNKEIQLTDTKYFANYSFTVSYSFKTQSWVSFHTYLPNYYVPEANYFYSGLPANMWTHDVEIQKFNNFYGSIHPYLLEYPYSYTGLDEILQNIQDYSKVLQYNDFRELIETDKFYFNKFEGYSNQQSTGITNLIMAPRNNMFVKKQYPKYHLDSKSVLVSKSGSFYNINTFWDMIKDTSKPVWLKSLNSISEYKVLNQSNHDYSKRSYKKSPLRSKELKLRFILDDRDDIKIVSGFTIAPTVTSYI